MKEKIPSVYRTKEEWAARYVLPEYDVNEEIKVIPKGAPTAKCYNGTFVGKVQEDVHVWKGIPYAKNPEGDLRFKEAQDLEPSEKTFEAYYFADSCMQPLDDAELASQYHQGEKNLALNIWNSTKDKSKKKPVLVFIHGGGWVQGGSVDPGYDGFNFAHYNPEILFVTINYRVGAMGQTDLTVFPDGVEFPTSMNNGLLDGVHALKWINQNIEAFGGDPNNVTVAGESAGGNFVSLLCVMHQAKGLIHKAIPMSGGSNLTTAANETFRIPTALRDELGIESAFEAQWFPFKAFQMLWNYSCRDLYSFAVRDGYVLSKDPVALWEWGATKDLVIMQGHTANEFRYYQGVFCGMEDMYDAICEIGAQKILEGSNEKFKKAYDEYVEALEKLGYKGKDICRQFMNDYSLAFCNTYQALCHAKNGGKGFCYTFEQEYKGKWAYMGAAHAVDVPYLFGNFEGNAVEGDKEDVDLSRKFQHMVANFCKYGDPSIDGLKWPEYKEDTRYKMMIGPNLRVEKNPEEDRVDAAVKMEKNNWNFKYTASVSELIPVVAEKYPEVFARYVEAANALATGETLEKKK